MSTGKDMSPREMRSWALYGGGRVSVEEFRAANRAIRSDLVDHPVAIRAAELMREGIAPESYIDEEFGIPHPSDREAVQTRGRIMRVALDIVTGNGLRPPPSTSAGRRTRAEVRDHIAARLREEAEVTGQRVFDEVVERFCYSATPSAFFTLWRKVKREVAEEREQAA